MGVQLASAARGEMQMEHEALSLQKDAAVLGTYESNAFILSLRRRDEFSTTHSFGYHRVPHIGKLWGGIYVTAEPIFSACEVLGDLGPGLLQL